MAQPSGRMAMGLVSALTLLVCVAACSAGPPPPRSPTAPSPSFTPRPNLPAPLKREDETLVVHPATARFPEAWREVFVVPYGSARAQLGTAEGGEGGKLRIGPEYGAPAPDGTWWFLDVAKLRLAHYDRVGGYIGAVQIPARLLVNHQYFHWSLPHILDDGTLVAPRFTSDGSALLRLQNGKLDELLLSDVFTPIYDDGERLYGFTLEGTPSIVDPKTGAIRPGDEYLTPNGAPFSFDVNYDTGTIRIQLGGIAHTLHVRTAAGAVAHVGAQVRAGADDSLHLFLTGATNGDHSTQLVGYARIDPGAGLGEVDRLPNPFSNADPGSPAQLSIIPGSATPVLIYVLADGVHVYEKT